MDNNRTPDEQKSTLSRRSVVAGATATVGTAITLRRTAAQATPDASPAGSPAASPVTQSNEIASSVEGVPNAYTAYPAPYQSVPETPGSGGTVTMLTLSYSPPPVDKGENQYWQELERRLGVTWNADLTPIDTYNERLATTLAGGDLPDITFLLASSARPGIYQAIEQGAFADLTDILGTDQIQQYPNLALIPDYLWQSVRINGRIWGVPKPVLRNNDVSYYRGDWGDALGATTLESAEQVQQLLAGFSTKDPDGNGKQDTYGLAPYGGAWDGFLINQMYNVPFGWRLNDDGTLLNSLETGEYRASLAAQVALFESGAYHPDAVNLTVAQSTDLMTAGRTGMASNGFAAIFGPAGYRTTIKEAVPTAELRPVIMPAAGGGAGISYQTQGFFGFNAISASAASDDARLDELLKILNYLYAPFGSDEERFLAYGIPGVTADETEDGALVANDQLTPQRSALVYPYLSENRFYYPGQPDEAVTAQKHNEAMAAVAVANPTAGLFSETQGREGATIGQFIADSVTAIVTGRESIDTLDGVIQQWKDRGGDTIRQEYQDALAANA